MTDSHSDQPRFSFGRRLRNAAHQAPGWVKWSLPPALAVLTTVTVWAFYPKPHIPSIYENTDVPPGRQTLAVAPGTLPGAPAAANGTGNPATTGAGGTLSASTGDPAGSTPSPASGTFADALAADSGQGTVGSGGDAKLAGSTESRGAALSSRPEKRLVALGDSITFGFNLPGAAPGHPSLDAYPFLVGKADGYLVTDLGVTGWTSTDLLNALSTPKYTNALQQANLVTIDIGSNDLLHASYILAGSTQSPLPPKNAVPQDPYFAQALDTFTQNLPAILAKVHSLTSAPIVLLDLYDPFPDGSSLHNVTEQLIAAANQVILNTAAQANLPVVDAYEVINHHQPELVRLNDLDIHPTIDGQKALATAVEAVLNQPDWHTPMYYAVSSQGVLVKSRPSVGPYGLYWLKGDEGCLVTGIQGNWLKVTVPSGQTGYVLKSDVTLLLRPFNEVSFMNASERLTADRLEKVPSGEATPLYVRDGVAYVPLSFLVKAANATMTVDSANRAVDVETPMHSGLIQFGLFNPAPANSSERASLSKVVLQPVQMGGDVAQSVSVVSDGTAITVDGEPINLGNPVLTIDGEICVPAGPFWTRLGGTVTDGGHGLPQLSADGS